MRLERVENRLGLLQSPGEVIAIIFQAVVSVLAGVESALRVGENIFNKGKYALRDIPEKVIPSCLIGVQVVEKQARVVISHLLEMRHHPALVYCIAMKTAPQLVVDTSAAHMLERIGNHGQQPGLAGFKRRLQQQVEGAGVRKLRGVAEPTELFVVHPSDALDQGFENFLFRLLFSPLEVFHPGQRLGGAVPEV